MSKQPLDRPRTGSTRRCTAAVLALALVLTTASPALAQQADEVDVTHGGWGAFGGFIAYSALSPMAQYATGALLQPDDPRVCALEPERCEPSAGDYTLVGLTMLAHLGVAIGGGWAVGEVAELLELDAGLGWGLAGGMLGVPTMGLIAYSLPRYEREWLWTAQSVALVSVGAVGGGLGLWAAANERGHAWPEFVGGTVGMVVGIGLGSLVCGDDSGCAAVPLLGGIGALLGAGVSGFAWGYEPDPGDDAEASVAGALLPYQLQLSF